MMLPQAGEPVSELEEPSEEELLGLWPDPFAGPPEEGEWPADASRPDPGPGWREFRSGGVLDGLPPDAVLAGFAEDAFDGGIARLGDDELIGLMCASRRLTSWQAAVELAAVSELDSRRKATAARPGSSRIGELVSAELSAALTLSARSADALLGLARDLARLPGVWAALFAGRIDRARAAVFAAELADADERTAAAVAAALTGPAGQMTTGQLRAALRALLLSLDPAAARRRAERGRRQARVEVWQETSGNAAIGGRELASAEVITADKRITAIAQALKDAGAPGDLDQLRAAVFTALLTGRDPATLLPADPGSGSGSGDGERLAGLSGTVHLTMPLSAWQGLTDAPGEAESLGPLDAATCRDLAARLSAGQDTKWCLTVTDPDGHAVGHACDRASPPGANSPAATAAWLRSLTIHWLESGTCSHPRRGKAYRPGPQLAHLVKIRNQTCTYPTCRRPATTCDLDHTVPYNRGGLTCECNLAPACRRHHKVKQGPGWQLTQPQPGILTWTTPSGRSYTVGPAILPV
jgi:hypothetical protein